MDIIESIERTAEEFTHASGVRLDDYVLLLSPRDYKALVAEMNDLCEYDGDEVTETDVKQLVIGTERVQVAVHPMARDGEHHFLDKKHFTEAPHA